MKKRKNGGKKKKMAEKFAYIRKKQYLCRRKSVKPMVGIDYYGSVEGTFEKRKIKLINIII